MAVEQKTPVRELRRRYRFRNLAVSVFMVLLLMSSPCRGAEPYERDIIPTGEGDLAITFIGHASLMAEFGGKIIHIDPWSRVADYGAFPDADIVLITHGHTDHLDKKALGEIVVEGTDIVCSESCLETCPDGIVARYGDVITVQGLKIEVVPAYNLTNLMGSGRRLVHPPGYGNGYIVTFGGKRVYFAGETENIPELAGVSDIDVCFLAVDSVYNMTPAMAAEMAKVIDPDVLYPIHFAEADMGELERLLEGSGIEVRIRNMK